MNRPQQHRSKGYFLLTVCFLLLHRFCCRLVVVESGMGRDWLFLDVVKKCDLCEALKAEGDCRIVSSRCFYPTPPRRETRSTLSIICWQSSNIQLIAEMLRESFYLNFACIEILSKAKCISKFCKIFFLGRKRKRHFWKPWFITYLYFSKLNIFICLILKILLLMLPFVLIWDFCVLASLQLWLFYIAKFEKVKIAWISKELKQLFTMSPLDTFDIIFVFSSPTWTEATFQTSVSFEEQKFLLTTQHRRSCHHFPSKEWLMVSQLFDSSLGWINLQY